MAGIRKTRTGRFEFVIKKKGVLDKPLYLTFDSEAEGRLYCERVEALLAKGILPADYEPDRRVLLISDLVRAYERDAHPSKKDRNAFGPTIKTRGKTPLADINAAWVDAWISEMKRQEALAPASIRARVGALARCTDWGVRKGHLLLPDNALRNLPDGYAQYTKVDTRHAGSQRIDVERDRRLEQGEFERIMATIDAGVLPRKQRPMLLQHQLALKTIIILAAESAMRMREIYTLTLDQVDLQRRTVFLQRTKNGDKRQVPLSTVAVAAITAYLAQRQVAHKFPTKYRPGHKAEFSPDQVLFPWWAGSLHEDDLAALSDYLSRYFIKIFETAGCMDLGFHDLRHEAVSRLFERTSLSDTQIMKITGHKSHRMLMRYSNLRASDLATAMW